MGLLRSLVPILLWTDLRKLQAPQVNSFQCSVEGMNFDFVAMNLTGFLFYSLYNSYGYFVNSEQTGQVDLNDVLFSYHALFATLICIAQIAIFPSGKNKIHWYTVSLLFLMWGFVLIYSTLTLVPYGVIFRNSEQSLLLPNLECSVSWDTSNWQFLLWNIYLRCIGTIKGNRLKGGQYLTFC